MKWNRRLFSEMYLAFKAGKADQNPVDYWYKSELDFFRLTAIPLASKIHSCGVFGENSDECFKNAIQNCEEWESKGRDIVSELQEQHERVEV